MAIIDKKRKIFGEIASAKTLTSNMPKLKKSSSFPSINNQTNSISFLTDLIKVLVGYERLNGVLVDILTISVKNIERVIKLNLKKYLRSLVSCGLNPNIPNFLKYNGTGITIPLKKIDFNDLFKVNPNSISGELLYDESTSNYLLSDDLNVFLYGVIQDEGVEHNWKDIFIFKFVTIDDFGVNPNNSLTIKAHQSFNNKTLNDLNDSFIDSINILKTDKLVNKIIDSIFGSITVDLNKTEKQLEEEAKINQIIDRFINLDENDSMDDGYFTFSHYDLQQIQIETDLRKSGRIILNTSEEIESSISQDTLITFNQEFSSTTNEYQQRNIISNGLDNMFNDLSSNVKNKTDKESIRLDFIQKIIDVLIKSIINNILTPKVNVILLVNYKIIYGDESEPIDSVDFLLKNKNLIKDITKSVSDSISDELLKVVLKEVKTLALDKAKEIAIDRVKNRTTQLLSLTGVPPEILRQIKGLG